jgi:signal transduction histidine kinase
MNAFAPSADPLPGNSSTRATRAASLGLAAVVACLAAFSIFAAFTTQTQVDLVKRAESLHEGYASATAAIRAQELFELEYLFEPSAEHLAGLRDADSALVAAMHEISAKGGGADAEFVAGMLDLHATYLAAAARLSAAVEAGDLTEAHRIDKSEADPIFGAMRDRVTVAAGQSAAAADSAFAALHSTATWVLILAPVVFAVGFVLLVGLWRVIEQREQATRETYRQIDQLSRLRSEFVSIVSHEFRTPLTGIQGFSEMMRDEELSFEEMREFAGDINKDARRLARLISDMLDLDRLESGRMMLKSEAVDFNRIVADTAARFRLDTPKHPIELKLDPLVPALSADPDRLAQVVTNLLSNAIKYSPNGGPVELTTRREDDAVTFTVRDHGVGIPGDHLEKIFDRYSRVESAETRGVQGTGLGLPIVRQIVQMHGGKVWVTSQLAAGSTFHVEFPLVHRALAGPRVALPVADTVPTATGRN